MEYVCLLSIGQLFNLGIRLDSATLISCSTSIYPGATANPASERHYVPKGYTALWCGDLEHIRPLVGQCPTRVECLCDSSRLKYPAALLGLCWRVLERLSVQCRRRRTRPALFHLVLCSQVWQLGLGEMKQWLQWHSLAVWFSPL